MKKSRLMLLGILFSLLALTGMSRANAVPCIVCECDNGCASVENNCLAGCKGNGTCETNCEKEYATCQEACLGFH